jgi:hypothetical protein
MHVINMHINRTYSSTFHRKAFHSVRTTDSNYLDNVKLKQNPDFITKGTVSFTNVQSYRATNVENILSSPVSQ